MSPKPKLLRLLISISLLGLFSTGAAHAEWVEADSLRVPRARSATALLPSGQVLVIGGRSGWPLAHVEIWDPARGSWSEAAPLGLGRGRFGSTATVLHSGKVLVVAGQNRADYLKSTEIYDPATDSWSWGGPFDPDDERGAAWHSATLLLDGRVLMVGGLDATTIHAQVTIYDPTISSSEPSWDAGPMMGVGRHSHTATLLEDGRVLVVGGCTQILEQDGCGGRTNSVELYEPNIGDAGEWQPKAPLPVPVNSHAAVRLVDGRVLVTGGRTEGGGYLNDFYLYDPGEDAWQILDVAAEPRVQHRAALLPSGKVMLIGGWRSTHGPKSTVEIFDPETLTVTPVDPLNRETFHHNAVLLPSGEVMVVGGASIGTYRKVEIYDPRSPSWAPVGSADPGLFQSTVTDLGIDAGGERVLLVVGGKDSDGVHSATAQRILADSGEVIATAGPLAARADHTATLLPDGRVLVAGGLAPGDLESPGAEIYDPVLDAWTATDPHRIRSDHTATLLPSGNVLLVGGVDTDGEVLWHAELFDPVKGTWEETGALNLSRRSHTASLLKSGKLLVTGGRRDSGSIRSSCELYDPTTDTWTYTGSLLEPREHHTATLLPTGEVFVVGGVKGGVVGLSEIFDPVTETWRNGPSLNQLRWDHSATALPSGEILVVGGSLGGALASTELFRPSLNAWFPLPDMNAVRTGHRAVSLGDGRVWVSGGTGDLEAGFAEIWNPDAELRSQRPHIQGLSSEVLRFGEPLRITGTGFFNAPEGAGGHTFQSAANVPVAQITSFDGELTETLFARRLSATGELEISDWPSSLGPGPYWLRVVVGGVPSDPVSVEMTCGLHWLEQPQDFEVALGESVELRAEAAGARRYQWYRNDIPVPEANGSTYTTPPAGPDHVGDVYHVKAYSGCTEEVSESASLSIPDDTAPLGWILSPEGGDRLPLSTEDVETTPITWTLSDDVRVCGVELRLLYLDELSGDWVEAGPDGTLPASIGSVEECMPLESPVTSLPWTLPAEPPSGEDGSRYRLELTTIDHAGNVLVDESDSFYLVRRNAEVDTLILTHFNRLQRFTLGDDSGETHPEIEALKAQLKHLARHERVRGVLWDLGSDTDLEEQYGEWDAGTKTANELLFGPGGIQEELSHMLELYPEVKWLVLVGDDRVVPMARVMDRTPLSESTYEEVDPGTTVGAALAADSFLSDDPLASLLDLPADEALDGRTVLPQLPVGRLVETPAEISRAVGTFMGMDGVLDLTAWESKALVTGYSFLNDGARKVSTWWSGQYAPESVDRELIADGWPKMMGEQRDALHEKLSGDFGLVSLNGHATHFEEGVPGAVPWNVEGLSGRSIYGSNVCGAPPEGPVGPIGALDGALIYSIGCHGGLSVPDDCAGYPARSVDLAQAYLARGAAAYVANTGYGWGLLHGVGLSERLAYLLGKELARGEAVAVGRALKRAKKRYRNTPRFDPYDRKVMSQWTLYGFPMLVVRTGSPAEELGGESIRADRRRVSADKSSLPDHLTRLELSFDFGAAGVYRKYSADGVELDPSVAGCPGSSGDPGCFFTLNGENGEGNPTSDEQNLPVEPFFIYRSALSGTSQHGVLWLGASYETEIDWRPLIAVPVTNTEPPEGDPAELPRMVYLPPTSPPPVGALGDACSGDDLDDEIQGVVVPTGETLEPADGVWIHRRHTEVDLEILYYNNQATPGENCDREGPEFVAGTYHVVQDSELRWQVPMVAPDEVWRVVVVWDDESARRWRPVELEREGDLWTGTLDLTGLDQEQVVYTLQAVDKKGNVSWILEGETLGLQGAEPADAALGDLVKAFAATLDMAPVDFGVELTASPQAVGTGAPVTIALGVHNVHNEGLGERTAVVDLSWPVGMDLLTMGGGAWTCDAVTEPVCGTADPGVRCWSEPMPEGGSLTVHGLFGAPSLAGTRTFTACVSDLVDDSNASNDSASVEILVLDDQSTDLSLQKTDGGVDVGPGDPVNWWILVDNHGRDPVYGALVEDLMPPQVENVQWQCLAMEGSFCSFSGTGDIADSVDVDAGGTLVYWIHARVRDDAQGPIVNTATVTPPGSLVDIRPENNVSAATTPLDAMFRDGFESGTCERWGHCPAPSPEP